jgi:hypothetical protein
MKKPNAKMFIKHKHTWNGTPADESRGKPFYVYCACGETRGNISAAIRAGERNKI